MLDFYSEFGTIVHSNYVHRLHTDFRYTDSVLQWFLSYLTDRTQCISLHGHCSVFALVHSGIHWGSVIGPILFSMHIRPLTAIIDSHSITHDSFADDFSFDISFADDSWQDIRDTSLYAVKST